MRRPTQIPVPTEEVFVCVHQQSPLGSLQVLESNLYNSTNTSCQEPNQYMWVYKIFHECVRNEKEEIGFILGLASILCWIIAAFPQLYENYSKGKADESLSIWFLLSWLVGDSSNLIGCIFTQQFPIQLYTAIYYVAMDIIVLSQFTYYYLKHRREARSRGIINEVLTSPSIRDSRVLCCLCLTIILPFSLLGRADESAYVTHNRLGRTLLQAEMPSPTHHIYWTSERTVGYVVGCLSSFFYLGSRLPQIIKNYRRGETEGLAPAMFTLAITGNTLYGLSILLQDPEPGDTYGNFILYHLPWLIGSIGTLSLDFFILMQIVYYSDRCRRCRKRRPLPLQEEDDVASFESDDPLVV